MAIKNKFIHFKTRAAFDNYLVDHADDLYNYTTFIKETSEIYTHGNFYKSSNTWDISKLASDTSYAEVAFKTGKLGDAITLSDDVFCILMSINNNLWSLQFGEVIRELLYNPESKLFGEGTTKILAKDSSIPLGAISLPLSNGSAAIGNSDRYAKEDHIHPSDQSKQDKLVSGESIKTINNQSLLGEGNIITPDSKVTSAANHYTPERGTITAGTIINSITKDEKGHIIGIKTANGLDASKITSGTINIERLPKGALERLVIVANQTARFALTTADVQEGDTVKQSDTGVMYFVINSTKLDNEAGYSVYTAGAATSVPWSGVTNAPTKVSQFTNDSGFTTNKGTVTSVAMSVPTGLSISGSPITASGTLALSYTSGFSIPSTAKQTNWDTAYEWGDHASAGYVKNSVDENITGIKNFMNGLKVFTNSATTSNEYNTTGKINITNYAAPIIFGSNSGKVWWSTQFQSSTTLLIGRTNSIPIRIQSLNSSEGNASEIYATRFYQNEKLVATEEWVTGKGYLTSVPAQTWGSITGKPTFATVATSGSYNDLTNKPTIPSLSGYATQNWVTSQGYLTSIPAATASVLGGVKIGSNISVSSGTISLTSANVTSALGFTPAKTSDIPKIPAALPNPYALTINGTSYTGSSAVSVTTPKILSTTTLSSSTVSAGYSYNNTDSRTISSLSGFSASNPDSVIISTAKLTFTASNAIKMYGLADLSGTYYIYCLSYMANGKIAVNGAVYA